MLEKFKLAVIAVALASLAACGGGDNSTIPGGTGEPTPGTDPDVETVVETGISYYPLSFYIDHSSYTSTPGTFMGSASDPFIKQYIIRPVNSQNLAYTTTATIANFRITEDGLPINAEAFPMLQRLTGAPVHLSTAIIIDTSYSMDVVTKSALLAKVKAFIAAAQASSDEAIKTQRFTLWAFASTVDELTSGFTTNATTLNTLLDTLETDWTDTTYGKFSNLYRSVVQAIGTYKGVGSASRTTPFDFDNDGDNDLFDSMGEDEIYLSNVVIFSAGSDSVHDFDQDNVKEAITWQSLVTYDTTKSADSSATINTGKPLFYVVPGVSGEEDPILKTEAEKTLFIGYNPINSDIASQLIAAQIASIDKRIFRGEQYLVRYASGLREGKHEIKFTALTNFWKYTLTSSPDYPDGTNVNIGHPADELSSLVEITGPKDEYISGSVARLSQITKLCPATRWVNTVYAATDYSWTINSIAEAADSSGCITIGTGDVGKTVVLTNTVRNETATVSVTN